SARAPSMTSCRVTATRARPSVPVSNEETCRVDRAKRLAFHRITARCTPLLRPRSRALHRKEGPMRIHRAISLAILLFAFGCSNRDPTPGAVLEELRAGGGNFRLVAHNPLFNRGMNAAPAIFEDESS